MPSARLAARTPFVRFLIAGGTNTVATAGLLVLLSLFLPTWLAVSIAFALEIIFSTVVAGRWVFRSHLTQVRGALFISAHIAIYFCGLLIVHILAQAGPPPAASGSTALVTAPLIFLAGRVVFVAQSERSLLRDASS